MTPSRPDPAIARSQFKEDLAAVMAGRKAARYGWRFKPDYEPLRLYADMWSYNDHAGLVDDYHLDMDMSYYRDWPPGVTFVNPETRAFDPCADARWLPANPLALPPGTNIGYHSAYRIGGIPRQMVCNSMVLEYYMSNHTPGADERWDPARHTLHATLSVLQTMLTRPYYGGRSAA